MARLELVRLQGPEVVERLVQLLGVGDAGRKRWPLEVFAKELDKVTDLSGGGGGGLCLLLAVRADGRRLVVLDLVDVVDELKVGRRGGRARVLLRGDEVDGENWPTPHATTWNCEREIERR